MITLLYWLLFIGFSVLGYYHFKWALTIYLAIKIVLIKPMLLFYLPGFPLLTLDRCIELALFILFIIHNRSIQTSIKQFKLNTFYLPWMLLLVAQAVLFFVHITDFVNSVKGLAFFVFEYVLLYLIINNTFKTREQLLTVIKSMGLVFGLVGLYGLFNKISGNNLFIDFYAEKAQQIGNDSLVFTYIPKNRFGIIGRIQSVVFHPIAYGGILAMFIPVFTNQFIAGRQLAEKWAWYVLSLVLTLNLVFANSRAALLSALIITLSSVYAYAMQHRTKYNTILIGVPLVSLLVLTSLFFKDIAAWMGEALQVWGTPEDLKGSTIPDRFLKFKYTWDAVSGKKLFGLGFGTVATFIQEQNRSLGGAESFWLKQLLEAGLFGVAAYLLFFALSALKAIQLFFKSRSVDDFYLATLVIGYLVFISLTGELGTFAMFVVLLALYANLSTANSKQDV